MKRKINKKNVLTDLTYSDQVVTVGKGAETHQLNQKESLVLTTQHGMPIADDQNSLKISAQGPTLIEDMVFRDKIFHFDHERIPERVVHARGFGAHGYFETYQSLTNYTKADIFKRKGEKTPVFVRFSTVAGNKGSFDLARDVRGFAVKFYTKEGNWDLVGNNIPVFFIQDAIKFPDLIHAAKDEPDCGFPQAQTAHDNFWDFISLMPESMHMIMWIMSDRAIPRSFRFMEGFGVHTFRMINETGKSTFVKFHWKPKLGMQSVVWNEAVKINGADPDFHRRDLWDAIQAKEFPEWELGLQLFDEKFANKFAFDVLDATKIIPEEEIPIQKVGRLVLDRCVDNFFAETEQVAFCTQNIVPGLDFSNDPLLQGRNFSYLDTQLKRLGSPNFTHLPINAPKCPMNFFQQDGHMTIRNPKGRVNYEPNSWDQDSQIRENPNKGFQSFPEIIGGIKERSRSESFNDHYSQARQFYISQTDVEQLHLANALIFELSKVKEEKIRIRMVSHLLNIDVKLAIKIANGLGIQSLPKAASLLKPVKKNLKESPALSILLNPNKTFKGRKLGILTTDGADANLLNHLKNTFEKKGATVEIIAPKIAGVKLNNGKLLPAQQKIDGGPSVLYDAIAIIVSDAGVQELKNLPAARDFVADAFAHFKFIAYSQEAIALIKKVGIEDELDQGCLLLTEKNMNRFVTICHHLRFWQRELTMSKLV